MNIFFKKHFGIILIVLFSIFLIIPFFHQGFFQMHDDTQVARVYEMGKSLKDGMFPVRWVQDLGYGYGYPIFNFYAPLAYYAGGVFNILGFDALLATKLMIGVGIILSGIFMYFLAKAVWGQLGGILSGLFYLYAPYHAINIYVRGDIGEIFAYAFIPLMFLGFYKVIKKSEESSNFKIQNSKLQLKWQNWKWITIGSLGYAGVILSHNLTAMMVTPFLFFFLLFMFIISYRNGKIFTIYYLLFTILLGLLISAFYWIPALLEMNYTNVLSQIGGGANFRDHFVCLEQFWNSPWGFAGSAPGCMDGMSFRIGKPHIAVFIISIILFLFFVFQKKENKKFIFIFSFFGFFTSILLMLEISKPIWEGIKIMEFFQYPWRFLMLASFFSSFIAGSIIWIIQANFNKIKNVNNILYLSVFTFIFLLLYFNLKLFQPEKFYLKNSYDYTNDFVLKWTTSRISDEYMPIKFIKPANEREILKSKGELVFGNGKIIYLKDNSKELKIETRLESESILKLNLAYFPSWQFFKNGKPINFKQEKDGVHIILPRGVSIVEAKFIQTPIEKFANFLSAAGILIAIIGIIHLRKKQNR